MVSIFALQMDDKISESHLNFLMKIVPREKAERIRQYISKNSANQTLLGEVLIRFLICKRLNITNEQIYFDLNEYGKKRLRGSNDLHFNISHSGKWIVCSIGKHYNGIDIEKIQPIDIELAKKNFTYSEYFYLKKIRLELRSAEFIRIWTLKESYIKCLGKGLSIPLDSFEFKLANRKIKLKGEQGKNFVIEQMCLNNEYYVAVCSYKEKIISKLNFIDIKELLQYFGSPILF